MHALWKLQLPSSVKTVRYGFDCPYHGKDCCDPEGGVCKRRLDAMQMHMQKAFDSCRDAFLAMQKDSKWTKTGSRRPLTTSPLGLFIEHRAAVWVEHSILATVRAEVPRLAPLPGIKSSIYGLRWSPHSTSIRTSRYICLCASCVQLGAPRPLCLYPGMSHERVVSFRILNPKGYKTITIKRMQAFLSIRAPTTARSGSKAVLVGRIVPLLAWDAGEREALGSDARKLLDAVTAKIVQFETLQQSVREQAEAAALEAGRQMKQAELLVQQAREQMQQIQSAPNEEAVLALQMTVVRLQMAKNANEQPAAHADRKAQTAAKRSAPSSSSLSSSPAASSPPSIPAALAKRALALSASDPASAAKAVIDSLEADARLSVYFKDAGWCSCFLLKKAGSDTGFLSVLWDCETDGCDANSASAARCADARCTHGGDGQDGREVGRLKKASVIRDFQAGEVRLLAEDAE